ncbi:MAG: HIT domain-containing protein [Myxococcota bacterium]|nr:HIT domain-containing protein [Myxococcota bacterium]
MTHSLWAPWRMDFILGPKPEGCVLCEAATKAKAERLETLVLAETELSFVIINRYPYTHGHIMVVPRRHVGRLEDLDIRERHDLMDLVIGAKVALDQSVKPHGINVGMNLGKVAGAGIEAHIHVHLVPRWEGDTNFMPVLADTRVMPEHLLSTYQSMVPAFEALDTHPT